MLMLMTIEMIKTDDLTNHWCRERRRRNEERIKNFLSLYSPLSSKTLPYKKKEKNHVLNKLIRKGYGTFI